MFKKKLFKNYTLKYRSDFIIYKKIKNIKIYKFYNNMNNDNIEIKDVSKGKLVKLLEKVNFSKPQFKKMVIRINDYDTEDDDKLKHVKIFEMKDYGETEATIGKDEANDIVLRDLSVDKYHGEFTRENKEYYYEHIAKNEHLHSYLKLHKQENLILFEGLVLNIGNHDYKVKTSNKNELVISSITNLIPDFRFTVDNDERM